MVTLFTERSDFYAALREDARKCFTILEVIANPPLLYVDGNSLTIPELFTLDIAVLYVTHLDKCLSVNPAHLQYFRTVIPLLEKQCPNLVVFSQNPLFIQCFTEVAYRGRIYPSAYFRLDDIVDTFLGCPTISSTLEASYKRFGDAIDAKDASEASRVLAQIKPKLHPQNPFTKLAGIQLAGIGSE